MVIPKKKHIPETVEKEQDYVRFQDLYESFFPALCHLANKYVQDTAAAKDLVQDAFLYCWSRKIDLRVIPSARSYLLKCVKNKCLNYLRNHKTEGGIGAGNMEDPVGFRDFVIENETYRILHNAINSLSRQEQRVIELTLDGLKNREIGEELGISVNTVKTTKQRAFSSLRSGIDSVILFLLTVVDRAYKKILKK